MKSQLSIVKVPVAPLDIATAPPKSAVLLMNSEPEISAAASPMTSIAPP